MKKVQPILFNFFLGAITCVLIVGFSVPSLSKITSILSVPSGDAQSFSTSHSGQSAQVQNLINQQLMSNLQEAESVLMAQSTSGISLQRYGAILSNNNVVANAPSTSATGVAGAALVGERLVVRGDFSRLSSELRDYVADPVSPPNPNITSAVHIHRGEPTENGPFQYALTVTLRENQRSGRFAGDYTLTSEQLQALSDGKLYVDLHTKQQRAGELRGILRPIYSGSRLNRIQYQQSRESLFQAAPNESLLNRPTSKGNRCL